MPQTIKNKIKHAWIISNKKNNLNYFFFNFNYIYNKNNNKTIGESTGHQDTCLYSFIGAAVHFASRSTYLAWPFIHLFG
jgi:hypothetical protein